MGFVKHFFLISVEMILKGISHEPNPKRMA